MAQWPERCAGAAAAGEPRPLAGKERTEETTTERDKSNRAGRANHEARLGVSEDRTADLANRASAANDEDKTRRRKTISQQGAPPDSRA